MKAAGVSRNLAPIYQTRRCHFPEGRYILRDLDLVLVHKMIPMLQAFPRGGDMYCGLFCVVTPRRSEMSVRM
jgi:hypothetical protein